MSKKTTFFLATFSFIFLVSQIFFVPRIYVQSRIITALQAPRILLAGLFARGFTTTQQEDLLLENQSLRAQLLEAEVDPKNTLIEKDSYILARVYSEYPFNNADKILVTAGKRDGIVVGSAVFASPGIYVGVVTAVSERSAQVRTIFDPGWEIPVYIGEETVNALLIGGYRPELTLIDKEGHVASGDTVYAAGKDFPYGATIGFVDDIVSQANDRFEDGHVTVPYTRNTLSEVYIQNL